MMKKKWRLSGSSLVEVLSGISILSLVLGMGLMLFQQLNGPYAAAQLHQARTHCRNALYGEAEAFSALGGRQSIGTYEIERSITSIEPELWQIEVRCYRGERLMDRRVRLSRNP